MKRSPKLRPNLWDGVVVLTVAVLAILCGVLAWGSSDQTGQLSVVVVIDGQEVERCPLDRFPDEEQLYTNHGYTLRVQLSEEGGNRGIRVSASDCPTQDCVHTGTISRGGQSIVCLPARIILQLEGGSHSENGPDIVIG